jgi:hypothetical protein
MKLAISNMTHDIVSRLLIGVSLFVLIFSSARLSGADASIRLKINNAYLELKQDEILVKRITELWGQPDRASLPVLLPTAAFFSTKLFLYYAKHGLIIRFSKNGAHDNLLLHDILIFESESVVDGVAVNQSQAEVTSTFGFIRRQYAHVYMWGSVSIALQKRISEESGLRMPASALYEPPWEGGRGISYFVPNLDWEIQDIYWGTPEKRVTRLVFHKPSATRNIYKIQKELDIRIEK